MLPVVAALVLSQYVRSHVSRDDPTSQCLWWVEGSVSSSSAGLSLERVEDVAAGGPRLEAAGAREKVFVAKF